MNNNMTEILSKSSDKKFFHKARTSSMCYYDTHIIHRALIQQIHEKRQGSANSKTRSQVRGGGRKPWKQKGTGRARAGSIRSPLWKGGGVIFGPKPKTYIKKINKKEKTIAIRSLLSNREKNTTIIRSLPLILSKPKSALLLVYLESLNIPTNEKTLFIVAETNINILLAIRNFKNIQLTTPNVLNTYTVINCKHLIIEKQALDIINQSIMST
uniref:Large ribosomal subunit protein uL4c n=1 Tax=Neogoniolithon spectabile TaxID=231755 RepID=A0A3G3MGS6_9FLOR|nr:ribosomal protein L4 [Neogoniolithon spectabile]AYR06036.1 ribosomal protein L4 [Neogoniolithon spectabile]